MCAWTGRSKNLKQLRGGLIGCGFFARNHINGWKTLPDVEIVAVCDADLSRAEAFAHEFGAAHTYVDAEQMLRTETLDFVDIVTQPGSHRALVELAAAHGVPVICQKPLAPGRTDAEAMVNACQNAGVPLMVHENFRWQRPMRALQQKAAVLGPLFFGRISFRTPYDVYADQPYLATDPRFIIADLGVHLLDLARFFFGEGKQLTCHTRRVHPNIRGEDVATILLKMQSGATCLVDMSYASQLAEDLFPQTLVHLEGSGGTATLGPHYALTTVANGRVEHHDVSPAVYAWSRPPRQATQEAVIRLQQHWIDCLRTNTMPETSGADNLKTLELVFGAYQSAEQRQPYEVRQTL
jgi:predicted dehydrogenase